MADLVNLNRARKARAAAERKAGARRTAPATAAPRPSGRATLSSLTVLARSWTGRS
jgi:hypothetical protein